MKNFKKFISIFILVTFVSSLIIQPSEAQTMPVVGFQPPVLLGLKIHPENPLLFDFIVDQGQAKLSQDELKSETEKLVKYFLAALTIPDKEVWVNLSPTEKDRIIPDVLGQTGMGKTMLEQDYTLKQLAASLTNPETDLGKKYWQNAGATPTLSKVWIVPEKAEVLESNGIVLVGERKLKVRMDEEADDSGTFKTTILPIINKQVNESKDFADVRQIYNSVILATWYKKALKESLLGRVYADKSKVAGVETDDKDMKQKIYEQYLDAFKKGAYNLIKEEADSVTGEMIPRKYFSGGISSLAPDQLIIRAGSAVQMQTTLSASSGISIVAVQAAETQEQEMIQNKVSSSSVKDEKPNFLYDAFNARNDEELAQRMQETPFATNVDRLTRYLLRERSLDRGMEAYKFVESNYAGSKNELVVVRSVEEISRDANPKEYLAQITLAALQDPRVASILTRRQFFGEALKRLVIAQLRVQALKTGLAKVVFYDPLLQITTQPAKEQLTYALSRLSRRSDRWGRLGNFAIPEGFKRLGVHGLIVPMDDAIGGFLFPPLSKGDYLASLDPDYEGPTPLTVDLGYEGPPRWQVFATEIMSRAGLDKGKIIQQDLRDRVIVLIPWDSNGRFDSFDTQIETYAEKAFEDEALVVDLIREKALAITGAKDEESLVVTESLARQLVEWIKDMGEASFIRLLEAEFYRKYLAEDSVITSDQELRGMLEYMRDPIPFMRSLPKLNELKIRVSQLTDNSEIRREILRSMPAVMAEMKTLADAHLKAAEVSNRFVKESSPKIESRYGAATQRLVAYLEMPADLRKLLIKILLGSKTGSNDQVRKIQQYLKDDALFDEFLYEESRASVRIPDEDFEQAREKLQQRLAGTSTLIKRTGKLVMYLLPRFSTLDLRQITILVNYLLTVEPTITSPAAKKQVDKLLLEHKDDLSTFLDGLAKPDADLVPRNEEDPEDGTASSGVSPNMMVNEIVRQTGFFTVDVDKIDPLSLIKVYAELRRFPAKGESNQLTVNDGDIVVTLVTGPRGEELTRVLAMYKDPMSFRGSRYFLGPVYVQGQLDVKTIKYRLGISQIEKLPNQVSASSALGEPLGDEAETISSFINNERVTPEDYKSFMVVIRNLIAQGKTIDLKNIIAAIEDLAPEQKLGARKINLAFARWQTGVLNRFPNYLNGGSLARLLEIVENEIVTNSRQGLRGYYVQQGNSVMIPLDGPFWTQVVVGNNIVRIGQTGQVMTFSETDLSGIDRTETFDGKQVVVVGKNPERAGWEKSFVLSGAADANSFSAKISKQRDGKNYFVITAASEGLTVFLRGEEILSGDRLPPPPNVRTVRLGSETTRGRFAEGFNVMLNGLAYHVQFIRGELKWGLVEEFDNNDFAKRLINLELGEEYTVGKFLELPAGQQNKDPYRIEIRTTRIAPDQLFFKVEQDGNQYRFSVRNLVLANPVILGWTEIKASSGVSLSDAEQSPEVEIFGKAQEKLLNPKSFTFGEFARAHAEVSGGSVSLPLATSVLNAMIAKGDIITSKPSSVYSWGDVFIAASSGVETPEDRLSQNIRESKRILPPEFIDQPIGKLIDFLEQEFAVSPSAGRNNRFITRNDDGSVNFDLGGVWKLLNDAGYRTFDVSRNLQQVLRSTHFKITAPNLPGVWQWQKIAGIPYRPLIAQVSAASPQFEENINAEYDDVQSDSPPSFGPLMANFEKIISMKDNAVLINYDQWLQIYGTVPNQNQLFSYFFGSTGFTVESLDIDAEELKRLNQITTASSGVNEVGGIDFDPTNMNLQIRRDGKGVPLPLPQQNLEQINIQGLFPVIINIVPVNPQTLPIFLGQAPKEPAKDPELAANSAT